MYFESYWILILIFNLDNKISLKNDSLEEKIARAESIALTSVKNLLNANINKELVKFIKNESSAFLDFCCLFEKAIKNEISKNDNNLKEFMRMLIDVRYAEFENCINFLNLIDHTLEIIRSRRHDFGKRFFKIDLLN
jgi:hypothetical protein